jgi:hypothetical protein
MQINHMPKDSQGAGDAKLGLKNKMLALPAPTNQHIPQQYQSNGKIDICN